MKSAIVVGSLVAVVTVAVAGVSAVTQVVSQDQAADQARAMQAGLNCNATIGPLTAGPAGSGAEDAAKLNEDQRRNVALIISIGKDRKLPPLAWQVAIQAGMTESGLRNLNYGDR